MTLGLARALDDKYKIVREIKKGGFGIVYSGIDTKLNKPVAIKEIAPNLLDDPKYLDMFQDEALNIAKLNHNNIVHIYELKKTADGHLYIIMEYIDGIDLEKIIRYNKRMQRRMPPHLAVHVMAEVCQALDYAHQRRDSFTNKPLNLVHQDISPSNIMVSHFGGVKLIDFGIASVKRHHKDKKDNKLRGKIPYMAPEQLKVRGKPDHRSDLFSLGLVMLESLTGMRLFNSQEEIIAAGRNPKWFRKALKGKHLTTPLVKVLLRALNPDLDKRYQSANYMYIDLLQYLISSNEAGELMDELSLYVSQVDEQRSVTTPDSITGTQSAPLSKTYTPSTASHFFPTSSAWQVEGEQPLNGGLSPALGPVLTGNDAAREYLPELPPTEDVLREEEVEADEDLRTVIDVIRISANNNRKRIRLTAIGLMLTVSVFLVADFFNHWTKAGIWLYDYFLPPAIEIFTVPPNAQVLMDGQPISGRTPMAIDEISPGIHKMELSLQGYKPVVKSVFLPRDGDIRIQGDRSSEKKNKYIFRFTSDIRINSQPEGATVRVNGTKLKQLTPAQIVWEVGLPLAIELEKPGFEQLGGYSLDTIAETDEVDDRRLWSLKVHNDTPKKYSITAVFRKRIALKTVPSGVTVLDRGTGQALGVTDTNHQLFLTAGTHKLAFRKSGLLSQTLDLSVDDTISKPLQVVLSRTVQFSASVNSNGQDIGAQVTSIKRNGREYLPTPRQTPFKLNLPAYDYLALFEKPGFGQEQVPVEPLATSVEARMTSRDLILSFATVDAVTGVAVPGAQIYYNDTINPRAIDSFLMQTDSRGKAIGEFQTGSYSFKVRCAGYAELSQTVTADPAQTQLTFRLSPSN